MSDDGSDNKKDDSDLSEIQQLVVESLHRQTTHSPELKDEIRTKFGVTTIFFLVLVAILLYVKTIENVNGYQAIAGLLCFSIIIWAIHFLFVMCSFEHLHYIRVRRRRAPSAKHLFLPYAFKENKHIPLTSISLIAAIRGSNVERMLTALLYLTFGLIFSAILMKWSETREIRKIDIELVMLFVSAYGSFLVPSWELRTKDKISVGMHYLSVFLAIIFGPLSFCLYQDWSTLSTILLCISFTLLFSWLWIMRIVDKKTKSFSNEDMDDENNLMLIHKYSTISLSVEILFFICSYVSYILFIFCMENDTRL